MALQSWLIFFAATLVPFLPEPLSAEESLHLPYHSIKDRPSFFDREYYGIYYNRNFPADKTREALMPQGGAYELDYRYFLSDSWSLSVFFLAKHFAEDVLIKTPETLNSLNQNESYERLSVFFLCLGQEVDYVTRIYHPFYAMAGARGFYMFPTKNLGIPIERSDDYSAELGVGAVFSLFYFLEKNWALRAYLERWRGTSTSKIHGFEIGAGTMFSI